MLTNHYHAIDTVDTVVILFPNVSVVDSGYLCGEVVSDNLLKTKNFYIHTINGELDSVSDSIIGTVGNVTIRNKTMKKRDWVKMQIQDNLPIVVELVSNNTVTPRNDCQVIVYDQQSFVRSELLLILNTDRPADLEPFEEIVDDHFKCLVHSLRGKEMLKTNSNGLQPLVKVVLLKVVSSLKFFDRCVNKILFIVKFSTLAIHMSAFVRNAIWGLDLISRRKGFTTLKSGNYILGLLGDWFGGLILIYWFMSLMNIEDVFQLLASQSEDVVVSLKEMVRYLMGSPADLKLNAPLNNVLGKFFLFHIDLWWAFLGYTRPLLELGFRMFVCLGSLGLSFQVAILADLLAVASFHVYIIYVYAARLYNVQLSGLGSLSRVFLGRKRNPLPGRVDSCPYSTEQLLIGTIAFTVLLFLLPTTLVYYVVFTTIRLVLIGVGGLLTQARFVLSALPLYSSTLWLANSPLTTSCVRLTPKIVSPGECVLIATPVQSSWWWTVKACKPDHLHSPPPPQWSQLFWDLITGRLIYPV